jgi:ribosomal-protein-alanine N-acetyltransferase
VSLRPTLLADAPRLAALHAASFEAGWTEEAIAELLAAQGAIGLVAEGPSGPDGFLIAREAAGEAEIITIAVDPARRGLGLGLQLVEAAVDAARAAGAESLFLEVAVDNAAALALYRRAGFQEAGRRPRYYARRAGPPADALILRRDLTG